MIEGKVKALFSDKERTELLFPITKTSAITNDDGVGLDAIISDTVYSDTNSIKATAVPVNADTLGGKPADEFATQNYVAAEIAKAQLNGGDVDLSGFATKDDVSNAVNGIDFPVDSVNGKTGVVVLSAGEVGATPASHAEDKNNPHNITPDQIGAHPNSWVPTAEQVGAAPAGFGLGTTAKELTSADDLNNIWQSGNYYWNWSTPANAHHFDHDTKGAYSYMRVDGEKEDIFTQTLWSHHAPNIGVTVVRHRIGDTITYWERCDHAAFAPHGFGLGNVAALVSDLNQARACGWYYGVNVANSPLGNLVLVEVCCHQLAAWTKQSLWYLDAGNEWHSQCVRYSKHTGDWTEWEWVNPPMVLGVEYRTTKRHKGKPVYALMLPGGTLAGKSSFSISLSGRNIAEFADGRYAYGDSIPTVHDMPGWGITSDIWCKFHSSAIYGYNNMEDTCSDARFYLEYTKTTD